MLCCFNWAMLPLLMQENKVNIISNKQLKKKIIKKVIKVYIYIKYVYNFKCIPLPLNTFEYII